LRARQAELEELARGRGIDWEGPLREFPNDPRLRLAGLATLLGFDAHKAAFRPEVPVAALQEGAGDEGARAEFVRLLQEHGGIDEPLKEEGA
jgi:hypothetical protein